MKSPAFGHYRPVRYSDIGFAALLATGRATGWMAAGAACVAAGIGHGLPASSAFLGFADRGAVVATFGRPGRTYRVDGFKVLVWPHTNLLTRLDR